MNIISDTWSIVCSDGDSTWLYPIKDWPIWSLWVMVAVLAIGIVLIVLLFIVWRIDLAEKKAKLYRTVDIISDDLDRIEAKIDKKNEGVL